MTTTLHGIPITSLVSRKKDSLPASAIPYLSLWYRGDSLLDAGGAYPDDAEKVATWVDKSVSGNAQNTDTDQQATLVLVDSEINNKPSVLFDSDATPPNEPDRYQLPSFIDGADVAIFFVMKIANVTGRLFYFSGTSGALFECARMGAGDGLLVQALDNSGGNFMIAQSAAFTPSEYSIGLVTFTPDGVLSLYKNGVLLNSDTEPLFGGLTLNNQRWLGAGFNGTTSPMDGNIAEFIVMTLPPVSVLDATGNYLLNRYL